jgi:DNA-directed RNA polymerase specialized sigma24 family protein
MSRERISMRKIKEVLRLKYEADLSYEAIGRSCNIGHSTVGEYLKRAQEAVMERDNPIISCQGKK